MASEDRLRELEEKYEDYKVYDNHGEKIGKVDDLFIDEADREEYIGVKMGFLGMKSTLIPMDIVRVNEGDRTVEVSESKDHVKSAPSFDDDEDITLDYEDRIRSYFGLESQDHESKNYENADASTSYEDSAERARSTNEGQDAADVPEYGGTTESQGQNDRDSGEHRDTEGSGFGESTRIPENEPSVGGTGPSADAGTRQAPTTHETEETETFREGGRTKIRRRVIREEIIEEDAPDDHG